MKRDIKVYKKRLFPNMSEQEISSMMYAMFGYDQDSFPSFKDMDIEGLGPAYVHNEVKRCVEEVDDQSKVYAGIGMDIPKGKNWGDEKQLNDPKQIEAAVEKAIQAGASGVVASREYEEISLKSLEVYGNAVKKYTS